MPRRAILLRILFASLALAAVFGAAGILLGPSGAVWRTAGTSMATAFAVLLLLAASWKMDSPPARPAATLAAALIVIEYLLVLASIWEVDGWFGSTIREWRLWTTIFFIAACGVAAIALMRMCAIPSAAWAGRVGLALDAVVLILCLAEVWLPYGMRSSDLDDIAAALAIFGPIAVICLIGAGWGDRRYWRWLGVAASALAFSLITIAELQDWPRTVSGEKGIACLIALAAAVAHANVVMICPLRPGQTWLRLITIASGIATAGGVALAVLLDSRDGELFARLAGACGVIAGCGTLATAILARINRRFGPEPTSLADVKPVTLTCPLCGKKQTMSVGRSSCPGCNVIIELRVDDPRCRVCGYSLLMLKSERCPECGTPVTPPTETPASAEPAGPQ